MRSLLHLQLIVIVCLMTTGCLSDSTNSGQVTETPFRSLEAQTESELTELALEEATKRPEVSSTEVLPLEPHDLNTTAGPPTEIALVEFIPDILISFGVQLETECGLEDNFQIWETLGLGSEVTVLQAAPGVDYKYPVWSPDGQKILFVESHAKPAGQQNEEDVLFGTDSIWVMNDNGSEAVRVSELMPRENFIDPNNCVPVTYIDRPPIWSPDGEYILFVHRNLNDLDEPYGYFLTEVATGKTEELVKQKSGAAPAWSSDSNQIFIVGDQNSVLIIDLIAIDDLRFNLIPPPTEFSPTGGFRLPINLHFAQQEKATTIIGTYLDPQSTDKTVTIWEVEILTGRWTLVGALDEKLVANPIYGLGWSVICNNGTLFVLDRSQLTIREIINSVDGLEIGCSLLKVVQDSAGMDWAVFNAAILIPGKNVVDKYGLWFIPVGQEGREPFFFEIQTPEADSSSAYSISNFSVKP